MSEKKFKQPIIKNLEKTSCEFSKILNCYVAPMYPKGKNNEISCYKVKIPKGTIVQTAYHKKASEVVYILKGEGYFLGKSEKPIKKGDILFFPPYTPHGFRASEKKELELLAVLSGKVNTKTDYYHL